MKICGQTPSEETWFEIDPQTINQNLFQEKRTDERQETTRKLIQEAFTEVKNNPEKYGKKFKTMFPALRWSTKTVTELNMMACTIGDHNADWVEQALEWAQRIHNGESWKKICNETDTANWYRLVVWKDGCARLIGGSRISLGGEPAACIGESRYTSDGRVIYTVPLVVVYKK